MDNILEIENLTKHYATVTALDNVSVNVPRGSICGLLGPNGAGKTTLLRIISSILLPDSGTVRIDGQESSKQLTRKLGYMPEERGLYDNMRLEDEILYFGMLKGASEKELRPVMDEYLELFNLMDDRRRRVKELSKGNQQKVQFITTIVHKPQLVILDEPFSGFDPINGALLQDVIAKLHAEGTTILLSSHNMSSIEEMCHDIILIDHGRKLLDGHLDDIKETHKETGLLATTSTPLSIEMLLSSGKITRVKETSPIGWRKGYCYLIEKKEGAYNNDILQEISLQSEILHFEEKLPSLQEIFLRYTTEDGNPHKLNINGQPLEAKSHN